MCTYILFSAGRYITLAEIVEIRISYPKMARNEQGYANQKSYKK